MAKYRVLFVARPVSEGHLVVEAASEEQAREIANWIDVADDDWHDENWRNSDVKIDSVTKVED